MTTLTLLAALLMHFLGLVFGIVCGIAIENDRKYGDTAGYSCAAAFLCHAVAALLLGLALT